MSDFSDFLWFQKNSWTFFSSDVFFLALVLASEWKFANLSGLFVYPFMLIHLPLFGFLLHFHNCSIVNYLPLTNERQLFFPLSALSQNLNKHCSFLDTASHMDTLSSGERVVFLVFFFVFCFPGNSSIDSEEKTFVILSLSAFSASCTVTFKVPSCLQKQRCEIIEVNVRRWYIESLKRHFSLEMLIWFLCLGLDTKTSVQSRFLVNYA